LDEVSELVIFFIIIHSPPRPPNYIKHDEAEEIEFLRARAYGAERLAL
jgi:hypothetical protein